VTVSYLLNSVSEGPVCSGLGSSAGCSGLIGGSSGVVTVSSCYGFDCSGVGSGVGEGSGSVSVGATGSSGVGSGSTAGSG